MGIPREAYKALESIVGTEYISDEPVVCSSYINGGELSYTLFEKCVTAPGCVVLPVNTREVQKIVKICNRYKIPYVPVSSFWGVQNGAKSEEFVTIDLKRMNRLEIDEKNMYAIVEPGVVYSQLQEEAMKRGLYTVTPGGGSQVSVLNNHLYASFSPMCYRLGLPCRRILGLEWVLGDGELVKTGSLATTDDPFWGEGPGIDLRGLTRGYIGWWGHVGVFTTLAVKLHPLFGPERLKPIGTTPNTTLELPDNRMKWYNITMPSSESLFKAMAEISRCEIGAAVTRVPLIWRYRGKARSREHFWELWEADEEEIRKNPVYILRVMLIGYTSEKQLQYEERVLEDIINELGGQFRRTRQTDESWIKNADSAGMWWPAGGYVSVEFVFETLAHSIQRGETLSKLKEEFMPPLVDEYGEKGWFQMGEMGHSSYFEFLVNWDPRVERSDYDSYEFWVAGQRAAIDNHEYTAMVGAYGVLELTGPAWGPNYGPLMDKVRLMCDPNDLANPPFDVHDKIIEKWAPEWKKKYRFGEV